MAVLDAMVVTRPSWRQLRRGPLTAIAAVFFGLGWVLSKLVHAVKVGATATFFGLGYAVSWSVAAMKVGYKAGQRGSA